MKRNNTLIFIAPLILSGVTLLLQTTPTDAAALQTPTITVNPDTYYPLDEVLYIEGRAQATSTVQVELQKQGAKPHRINVKSDTNGEWVVAEKIPLEAGDWQIQARSSDGSGNISEWSNPRIVKVIISGIVLGGISIKFAALSLILVLTLLLGGAIVLYYIWRVKRLSAFLVSKEIHEAQDSVREGMSEIRRDLLGELRLMQTTGKVLGPEELARKEHLIEELDKLERNMEQQIRDIEEKTR